MPARVLYFFRHGQTNWNASGRFQGHVDIELNAKGVAQARALAAGCEGLGIKLVLSSDLKRASATAREVATHLGIPMRTTCALREVHMGEAQGRTYRQNADALGEDVLKMWFEIVPGDVEAMGRRFPQGESRQELVERFGEGMRELLEHPETPDTVAISSHGGAIRIFLLSMFPEHTEALAHVPNASLFKVSVAQCGTWRFEGLVHEGGG